MGRVAAEGRREGLVKFKLFALLMSHRLNILKHGRLFNVKKNSETRLRYIYSIFLCANGDFFMDTFYPRLRGRRDNDLG